MIVLYLVQYELGSDGQCVMGIENLFQFSVFQDKDLCHNHHVITILHARHLINLIEIEFMDSPLQKG